MLYKVTFLDESQDLVTAPSLSAARKKAKCLHDVGVRNIVVQHDCDDADDEELDADEDQDEDEDEVDEDEDGDSDEE